MKRLIFFGFSFFLLTNAFAYKVGDLVPSFCWSDVKGQNVCTSDFPGSVIILDFNAGWCPPCNEKMTEISKRVNELAGKPIVIFSNSVEGWKRGEEPNQKFLGEWKQKHAIPATIQVVGSPISDFIALADPSFEIPNFAIIDSSSTLSYRSSKATVSEVFKEASALVNASR